MQSLSLWVWDAPLLMIIIYNFVHFQQVSRFCLSLWPNKIPLCANHIFIIRSSPDGHLGWFYVLATLNRTVVNTNEPASLEELRVLLVLLLGTLESTRRVCWNHLTCPGLGVIGRTSGATATKLLALMTVWANIQIELSLSMKQETVHSAAKYEWSQPRVQRFGRPQLPYCDVVRVLWSFEVSGLWKSQIEVLFKHIGENLRWMS